MSWVTPRTWSDLEFVTDTILNQHIRDNLNMVTRVINEITNASGIPNSGSSATKVWEQQIGEALLATNGDTVVVECSGTLAANGNSKTVTVSIGGSSIGTFTTTGSATPWHIRSVIRRHSATASMVTSVVIRVGASIDVQLSGPAITWANSILLEIFLDGDASNDLLLYWAYAELKRYGA